MSDNVRTIIQNYLNMVCFETQGKGGRISELEELLDLYLEEGDEKY